MKRPKILEENNDLLEQVNYLIELEKYCDYLEEQNKQLSIHGVVGRSEQLCQYDKMCVRKRIHNVCPSDCKDNTRL